MRRLLFWCGKEDSLLRLNTIKAGPRVKPGRHIASLLEGAVCDAFCSASAIAVERYLALNRMDEHRQKMMPRVLFLAESS